MNQKTEIRTLNITQYDIDRSIKRREKPSCITECCVVSTAAQRAFREKSIVSASGIVYDFKNGSKWNGGEELHKLMQLFDTHQYSQITPRKFVLVRERMER